MKVATSSRVLAPPGVVFRFSTQLDHLRFTSPRHRYEWCTTAGAVIAEGRESEVRIQQHRHGVSVRFRTVRLEPARYIEDEFLTWPVKGARHTICLVPVDGGAATDLEEVITWDAPWYLRRALDRYVDEQRSFFDERLAKAKRLIESVFAARGERSFEDGIFPDAARVQIEPVVPLDWR